MGRRGILRNHSLVSLHPCEDNGEVILGTISKHTKDKEAMRNSQHSFSTFSHTTVAGNLMKHSQVEKTGR